MGHWSLVTGVDKTLCCLQKAMCTATGRRNEERSKGKEETLKRWTDSGIGGEVKQA